MSGGDLVELKFRLFDGSDIGPFQYPPTATVSVLKERIVSEWPNDKTVVPNSASEIKLINNGRVLENAKTVEQCKTPFDDDVDSVITMHVVVQPSGSKEKPERRTRQQEAPTNCGCCCTIM
ncbi:Membrane-anchored ubiquitin-fold protein 4 [Cardamine amara subsp. amara]|uniref:Membrane-anchored ubiquitin-fold protein n=1 Tax=Cardamine amara subsp. amara TaxID=228776 RepID=A0ABD1ATM1_CARAN